MNNQQIANTLRLLSEEIKGFEPHYKSVRPLSETVLSLADELDPPEPEYAFKEIIIMKFETINNQLCRMVEPEPLNEYSKTPCIIRNKYRTLKKEYILSECQSNPTMSILADSFEIIGYPVEDGSRWWALYQMMQGKKVSYKSAIGNVCLALNQDGNVQFCYMDDLAYIGTIRSKLEFAENYEVKTGWQLYKEPKPEPPKEPKYKICTRCGGSQSVPNPVVSNTAYTTCPKCGGTGYEIKPEQALKVGDWAKYDIDSYLRVIETPGREKTLCKTLSGVIVYPYTSCLTKVSPSEVVLDLGNGIKGRVCMPYPERGLSVLDDNNNWIAQIDPDALDAPMRELVESLLKAQGEK